jgi:SAM-dependent methyltransferase
MTVTVEKLVRSDRPPAEPGSLTDTAFWEGYWGRFSLPDAVDERRSFDRALASRLRIVLDGVTGEAIEIGCAPGRWLAFLSSEFGLGVAGIEFTADGAAATRRNLELLGVRKANILEADFLVEPPSPTYDVVVSLGFVEHFQDVTGIVSRHEKWLRPGGLLIIGVPNFRGVHGWLQKALDPDVLARHNLDIMDPQTLTAIGRQSGLIPESAVYLGSLEPSLPIARAGIKRFGEFLAKVVLRALRLVRAAPVIGRAMDRWNNPLVSSYILATYRKPS